MKHDVMCVVLRYNQQNGVWSADIVEEGEDVLLALELGDLSGKTSSGVICRDSVREVDVSPLLT